jgi:hypothetical protein
MSGPSSAYPESPWVMTLFAPPALRVNGEEYRQVLWDATLRQQLPPLYVVVPLKTSSRSLAARVLACRRAWARRGWRPYDRSERFGWRTGDITVIKQPTKDEA